MRHNLLGFVCDAKHEWSYETHLLLVTIKLYSDKLTIKSRKIYNFTKYYSDP